MKKYLMTGIAALAIGAAFVSCSKDIEQLSQEELNNIEVQKIKSNYEKAFTKVFGTANNRDNWGFSDAYARTRGNASTNANMWADYGYDVPRELTQGQIDRVVAYFQKNKLEWGGSKDWTEFFVQQVYKGGTKPLGNKENPNGYSAEEYHCANGEWITGGKQMDYLYANMDKSEHINNFNNGNGSPNGSVQNSPGETYLTDNKNGFHTDMIQLMVDSKAENFGYNNSNASKYYWDKYVLIDGDIIDTWATSAAGGNVGESVSGRAFVGFDFEQFYKEEDVYTGSWTFNGKEYKYVVNAPNKYCGYREFFNDDNKPEKLGTEQQWLDDGYLPVYNTAGKEWAKVEKCADGYFSDWIVCIAPGHKINTPSADLRVMAEDLSAGEEGDDFDFNDVVFDVYFSPNAGEAYVMVLAAGGTLPLKVNGTEVHGLFGKQAGSNGLYPMINTHAEDKGLPGESGLAAQKIQLTGITVNSKSDVNQKVKIEVQKSITTADGVTSQQWIELENTGAAACKIGVDPKINWANERENVNSVCNMNQWVTGESKTLEPTHP